MKPLFSYPPNLAVNAVPGSGLISWFCVCLGVGPPPLLEGFSNFFGQ